MARQTNWAASAVAALSAAEYLLAVVLRFPLFWMIIFVMTPTAFVYWKLADMWLGGAPGIAVLRAAREKPIRLLIWLLIVLLSTITLCLCWFALVLILWLGLWVRRVTGLPSFCALAPAALYAGIVLLVYVAEVRSWTVL
jgi:hypothetical protein